MALYHAQKKLRYCGFAGLVKPNIKGDSQDEQPD